MALSVAIYWYGREKENILYLTLYLNQSFIKLLIIVFSYYAETSVSVCGDWFHVLSVFKLMRCVHVDPHIYVYIFETCALMIIFTEVRRC